MSGTFAQPAGFGGGSTPVPRRSAAMRPMNVARPRCAGRGR